MVAYETQVTKHPSFATAVFGEVAPDGNAIGLRIERSEQGPLDICLRIEDLQHIVSMMLVLGCEAQRLRSPQLEQLPVESLPLPLHAVNVGQDDSHQTFLMLEVGPTSLTFTLPNAVLGEIGQTFITLSARAPTKPS